MIRDMIYQKRLDYIGVFGRPPKEVYLTPAVYAHLKAEIYRSQLYMFKANGEHHFITDKIEGMHIKENIARNDIRISFPHPDSKLVWY